MIPRLRTLLLAALLSASWGLSGCWGRVESEERTAGRTAERWQRILIDGKPAGFTRQYDGEVDGKLTSDLFQHMVFRRGDQPVEMEMSYRTEETAGGMLTGFRLVQRMASTDLVTTGVVKDKSVELTVEGAGPPRKLLAAFDPLAVGPRKLERLLRDKLQKPGDQLTAVQFFPEKNACGKVKVTLGAEESTDAPGAPMKLRRRSTLNDVLPGVETREWIDKDGEVWKSATELLGMRIETYRSTSAAILQEKYASPPEIFYSTSVKPSRPLATPQDSNEVTYRFSLKSGDFRSRGIDSMFRSTGQSVVREESPGIRVVRIERVQPGAKATLPVKPPAGLEDALTPNSLIQSDDERIWKIAAEAVGEETDAFEAARKLERWVRTNIQFKDLKTPFASASEVVEKREGDCTEHGVLLAALARAAGIPARVVSGLVYYQGAFVGHLWTEVYIDRWIQLDGTRGKGPVGPDHIALTASTLANSSAADLFFDLAQVVGNLKIEVLEER